MSPHANINIEKELIKAIKLSDGAAFKKLCQIYYEPLFRFLWRKTRVNEAAEDLVQDLFLNVWKARENLDENQSIKAYIYRAANNLAINYIRKKQLVQKSFPDNLEDDPADNSKSNMEFREVLDDILQDIPENQRAVFILNKFEGLKYKEIAETLQISIKTVESRMSKTLKVLRERLAHLICLIIFVKYFLE